MGKGTTGLDEGLYHYIVKTSVREPGALTHLREATDSLPMAVMQVSPDQGQFLRLLVELIQARRVLEIGTFTGYSALSMALALPQDGDLVTCDIDPETTKMARAHWDRAGVGEKITLKLGPALDSLDALIADGGLGSFDLAFIDADKVNYQNYFERALTLIRTGGLICIDNVLWGGSVADDSNNTDETRAIRAFNQGLKDDSRVSISLLSVADGLTLAVKR